jgi:hypothetical protein
VRAAGLEPGEGRDTGHQAGRGRVDRHIVGAARFERCDLLVFTGDWVPDHELARAGQVPLDPGTHGSAVDTALETAAPRVFAAGNLIHPAETADVAALSGRHADPAAGPIQIRLA